MTRRCRTMPRRVPRARQVLRAALVVAAVAGLAGCGQGGSGEASAGDSADQTAGKVVDVEVLTLQPGDFSSTIRITGTVEAIDDAVLSAEEGGVVKRFLIEKGTAVTAGQAIAQIDDRLLRAQVAEAEAAAELARETFERQARLWLDQKVGSELAYLKARHEATMRSASHEALQTRLHRTTIRAPFDGVFDERFLDAGEMAAPGSPVARVIGTGRLRVTGGVPERFAADVRPETPAHIRFAVLPGVEIHTSVVFAGASIDPRNRTFTVELLIDDPPPAVKPEMTAVVEIERAKLASVLVVPQSAVTRTEHGFQVFVATEAEDGRLLAAAQAVALGLSRANQVVVESGLEPGARLITLGKVNRGDRIRIVRDQADSAGDEPAVEEQP